MTLESKVGVKYTLNLSYGSLRKAPYITVLMEYFHIVRNGSL